MTAELRYGTTVVKLSLGELRLLRASTSGPLDARLATIEEAVREGQSPSFSDWDVFLGGDPSECRATMVQDLLQAQIVLVHDLALGRWTGIVTTETGRESPDLFTMHPFQASEHREGAFKEACGVAEIRASWYCRKLAKEQG